MVCLLPAGGMGSAAAVSRAAWSGFRPVSAPGLLLPIMHPRATVSRSPGGEDCANRRHAHAGMRCGLIISSFIATSLSLSARTIRGTAPMRSGLRADRVHSPDISHLTFARLCRRAVSLHYNGRLAHLSASTSHPHPDPVTRNARDPAKNSPGATSSNSKPCSTRPAPRHLNPPWTPTAFRRLTLRVTGS